MLAVNRYFDLRGYKPLYIFQGMNDGERVKAARKHGGFTQPELAKAVGMKQSSLSYLENPENNAQGSAFTVRIARLCAAAPTEPPVAAPKPTEPRTTNDSAAGSYLIVVLVLYFLPTFFAMTRSHHNSTAIFLLNLLLGWTLLGWVIALVWSFTAVIPRMPAKNV